MVELDDNRGARKYVVWGADGRVVLRATGDEDLRSFKQRVSAIVGDGAAPAELFQIDAIDENGDVLSSKQWIAGDSLADEDVRKVRA